MEKVVQALIGAWVLALSYSSAWAWQTNINGTATSSSDRAHAVTVDGEGNVLAVGVTQNTDGGDFTVIKLEGASGAELWRQEINGTADGFDEARAVTVDARGDVVAVGVTTNSGTGTDFTVIKFDGASGAELWRQVINGTHTLDTRDEAHAVAMDAADNVVAAGFTTNNGTSRDLTLIKFDRATGDELWRQVINGTRNGFDEADAVTVDASGDVVVAGHTENADIFGDFTVVKFDGATGVELWRRVINGVGNGFDSANAVTVDDAGHVLAAGEISTIGGFFVEFIVVKLDGVSGSELWRQVLGGGFAHAVVMDARGDVVAAGLTSAPTTLEDFTVVKLDGASGTELWRQLLTGLPVGLDDEAFAVTVDVAGDVVAAGRIGFDFAVAKLDGASGAELWRQLINGTRPVSAIDEAVAVAVDARGDVVAVGRLDNNGTFLDFIVVKLRGTDGADFSPTTEVAIAIRPRIDPNRINPNSTGHVRVAILSGDGFDATTVLPNTVRFGATGTEAAPVNFVLRDVDGDGNRDMILRFLIQETGIECGQTSAFLSGETSAGQLIEGSDSIKTVRCNN
jgi:uncharacterized delta-60 repeat protein